MKEDIIIEKLTTVLDKKFDQFREEVNVQFDAVGKRFDEQDARFERIFKKLLDHDEKFDDIYRRMATKDDLNDVHEKLDWLIGEHQKHEQERVFMNHRMDRIDKDVEELKQFHV